MPYTDKTNKEYQKEYYLKNKQLIIEKRNIYYLNHYNDIKYYQKEYYRNKINKCLDKKKNIIDNTNVIKILDKEIIIPIIED